MMIFPHKNEYVKSAPISMLKYHCITVLQRLKHLLAYSQKLMINFTCRLMSGQGAVNHQNFSEILRGEKNLQVMQSLFPIIYSNMSHFVVTIVSTCQVNAAVLEEKCLTSLSWNE